MVENDRSYGRKQRYMSVLIQSCVWEECINFQKQTPSGKNRFIVSSNPTSMQNCVELMENQLSSSGTFSKDSHRLRFSDIQQDLNARRLNPGQLEGNFDVQLHGV